MGGASVRKLKHCYRHDGNDWVTGRDSPALDSLKLLYRYLKLGLPYRDSGSARLFLLYHQVVAEGVPL